MWCLLPSNDLLSVFLQIYIIISSVHGAFEIFIFVYYTGTEKVLLRKPSESFNMGFAKNDHKISVMGAKQLFYKKRVPLHQNHLYFPVSQ